jgi:hypothetical protein
MKKVNIIDKGIIVNLVQSPCLYRDKNTIGSNGRYQTRYWVSVVEY